MAEEITLSGSLAYSKGGVGATLAKTALLLDVTGTDYILGSQQVTITGAGEALDLCGVTTPGMIAMFNTDSTNYVEYFAATGETAAHKLLPGDFHMFRAGSTVPFVLADTAIVQIDYLVVEA